MKITAEYGEIEINDKTLPSKFLEGPATIAIQDLGVGDPTVLVFPGRYNNKTNEAVDTIGLDSELTGYVRLTSALHGVVPDLSNLRRVDGNPITSQDFDAVTESLVEDGHIAYATEIIRISMDTDPDDPWPIRPENIVNWV